MIWWLTLLGREGYLVLNEEEKDGVITFLYHSSSPRVIKTFLRLPSLRSWRARSTAVHAAPAGRSCQSLIPTWGFILSRPEIWKCKRPAWGSFCLTASPQGGSSSGFIPAIRLHPLLPHLEETWPVTEKFENWIQPHSLYTFFLSYQGINWISIT